MELSVEELGIFDIIAQVGAPIAAAMFMGGFIFLIIRKSWTMSLEILKKLEVYPRC